MNPNLFYLLFGIVIILLLISILFKEQLFKEHYSYSFIPSSSPIVTSDYNPFHTYISPDVASSIVTIPPEYKTKASQSWIANAVAQCNSYNTSSTFGAPQMPQDCPDSSFTYIDQPDYKGCIQLQTNSNYCMSDMFGNYKPNIDKLNVSRF